MIARLLGIVSLVFASAAFAPSFAKATAGKQASAKTSPGAGPSIVVGETEKGTFGFETIVVSTMNGGESWNDENSDPRGWP